MARSPNPKVREFIKMLNYNTTQLETSCNQLINSFGSLGSLGKTSIWKWDNRFETVLAEFNVTDKESVHQIITRHMDSTWEADIPSNPPGVVQTIIDYFGGLNPGQILFTSDPDQDGILLCAWWPWGNNTTISIRLAVFADSLNDEENDALTQRFRGWFGL